MSERDDYLWDGSGPPDDEVRALEDALRPLAHDGRPLGWAAVDRTRPRWPWLLAAAVVVAGGGAWWATHGAGVLEPDGVTLTVVRENRRLTAEEWFMATADSRELQLARGGEWLGDLTLEPGSRLRVDGLAEDKTTLFLAESGRMEAFVSADARPRFFQVGTPAARCVDLGCEYVLEVDEQGAAHVHVTMGWVAFEYGESGREREVFVPRGAECRATREDGPGTPRFIDMDADLTRLLDEYDAESDAERRRQIAEKLCGLIDSERDTLVLYHLLQDDDPVIAARAEERLVDLAGLPPEAAMQKIVQVDRGLWLAHLRWLWH